MEETLDTLQYDDRAKRIKNKPTPVNFLEYQKLREKSELLKDKTYIVIDTERIL